MSSLTERIATLSPEQRALIAQKLKKGNQEESARGRIPARSRASADAFPLSFTQQRLWFLDQLEPGNPFYNIPSAFRLTGSIDREALERSLNEMARRHESLHTTFAASAEGQPVQVITPALTLQLPVLDLTATPEAEREAEALRLIVEDARKPCDLARGPLWWAVLLRLSEQEHILLLTHHHTVFDGWSLGVFIRELAVIYDAFSAGRPSPLPELALQYADYAHWQRQWFQGEVQETQTTYWKKQLGGTLPILELPTDRPRPTDQSFSGAFHSMLLPLELYDALKELSRQEGVTLFMTLLAAFKTLLYRYTGQDDVIVGFPITGRNRQEIEGVIGPFVNTLALRTDLSGDPSFTELLGRVREVALGAYANQDMPFDLLVEAVQPERHINQNPLFQVMFTLQNALPAIELNELKLEFLQIDMGTAKFDLSLDVYEGPEGPTCIFEYNTDLFDAGKIAGMAEHYRTLLEGIVADRERQLSQVPLLSEAERHRLLVEWNQTGTDYALDVCFQQLFEVQVERTPEAVAVAFEGEELTYRDLNRRANRLAQQLVAHGVAADVVVPLLAERSSTFLTAVLAVFKAGGAYLPLDPRHPAQRIAQVVGRSGARLALATREFAPLLDEALGRATAPEEERPRVLYVEDLLALEGAEENLPVRTTRDGLAYVLFTSGSTGTPKGVMIEHAGMLNHLYVMNDTLGLSASDVVAQTASQCFDISVWQFLSVLLVGGRVEILGDDVARDPVRLVAETAASRTSILEVVPSLLHAMLEEIRGAAPGRYDLSALRWLIPTGEALTPGLCREWLSLYPAVPMLNAYGPAECADDVTLHAIHEAPAADVLYMPIGRPVANMRVYILDEARQPVPVGVLGELYIGGVGVGRGYLNDAERTAENFLEDPFAPEPGARLYKTGDLGRFLPDGRIVFLGRADHQVKVRGFRIELGEIEEVLRAHAAVRDTVVVVREDVPGDKRLVGYAVVDEQAETSAAELSSYLKTRLPEYMTPAAIVLLPALPLTPNGKIDRRALPAPEWQRVEMEGNYVGPRTLVEEMLSEIWAQAFNLNRVSIHDDFFALGGHSLLAFQIIAQVRKAFQVELPLKSLFQTPTVAGLAAVIAERRGKQEEYEDYVNSLPTLEPDPENWHEPFPLTDVQQAYWIGRSGDFELGNVSTHNYDEMEFENLDLERFKQAWQRLVERHGMLRAIVHSDGRQQILEKVPAYEINVLDLRGRAPQEVEAEIEAVRHQMSHQILDTSRWPVFDLRVTLLDEGCARLHFSTDSLTFDAWSFVVLIKELAQLHENIDAPLPELELSFRDYVLAETSLRDSEQYRRSQEYWQKITPLLPPAPELPLVKNPSAVTKPKFTRLHNSLEPDVWRRLKAKATQRGLTGTGILLAAYAETLTAWSKSPQFTLNLTFLHRHPMHPQVNELVGEFTSLTLLEVNNSTPETFAIRARRTQERLWSDLEHHYYSGIQVLRDLKRLQGGVETAKMPIVFTSALTLPIPDKEKSPISLRPVHSITQTSQVLLDCGVWEDGGAMFCNWDVVEELFPAGLLPDMFAAYFDLLHQLADTEEVWERTRIKLIPPAQLQRQEEVNRTEGPVPTELLHTLFAKQAAARPDHPAVVTSRRTLTYDEVYRRSNQLGRVLRQRGARPNTLVAVVMEKGWEQVVATLGVLQSGAAYLPIDPELPRERIWYLLRHGEVRQVLTQSWIDSKLEWPEEVERLRVDLIDALGTDDSPLEPAQGPEDLAYVIFTSGSTGLPKGVMIDHRGAANTIIDLNRRFAVGGEERVLALSALNFDLSVYDIFGTLAAGGTVVIPDASDRLDPAHWHELVAREGVTLWNSVPALMGIFVEYVTGKGLRLPDSLRLVWMSGDWIPLALPDQIKALAGDVQVISMGGATEASIWSIIFPVETVEPEWQSIPYGRAMLNQTFHVLDHTLEACPTWVPGQLYIGGIGVAKGYWRDQEKTAASFITHPRTGQHLYKTGDLGRFLPDGNIEFLGREDFQVKVQGHRIELGEIEAALAQHPSIRDAVVTAVGERKGNKKLVAYVVPLDGQAPERAELRDFLQQKLPVYMVPSAFVVLEALPLTPNGKVDRKSLPLGLDPVGGETEANFVAPRTRTEEQLAAIWSELLELEKVSVEDNFFELGGDSMISILMLTRIRETFEVALSLRSLFETPSIAGLAETIEALRRTAPPTEGGRLAATN
jgi:amino acid adenylation domain-containing protein